MTEAMQNVKLTDKDEVLEHLKGLSWPEALAVAAATVAKLEKKVEGVVPETEEHTLNMLYTMSWPEALEVVSENIAELAQRAH